MRIKIPKPPEHHFSTNALVQEGLDVTHIWVFNQAGRAAIETQYKTAAGIQAATGCSRASAYRLIARTDKRYWIFDLTDPDNPTVWSCLPVSIVQEYTPYPVGNPNFANGIYQQQIARRRKPRGIILTD